MLQGLHPQLQHEQLMEHLEALSRQQAQHQQAVAAQQHMHQQQQQQHFSAERIQELLKNARSVPDVRVHLFLKFLKYIIDLSVRITLNRCGSSQLLC